jgi:hypothetical protein
VRLYHFTALEYLPSILEEGLTRGDVPLGPRKFGGNAVWLTLNADPAAQAFWAGEGERLATDEERRHLESLFGKPVPPGSRFADKRAVLLAVEIPDEDPKLVQWLRFARLRGVNPKWLRNLRSSPDWFIYRGAVPTDWIIEIAGLSEQAQATIASFNAESET